MFPGFCSTLFAANDDLITYNLQEDKDEGRIREDFDIDDWYKYWGNAGYESEVAKGCVDWVAENLPEESGIWQVVFEKIQSPREYNFTNDSINVTYEVDLPRFAQWFNEYITTNAIAWVKYLTRYNSRSGFSSFYSSNPQTWHEDTKGFSDFEGRGGEHMFGALLEFFFHNEDEDAQEDMHEYACNDICGIEYVNLPPEAYPDAPIPEDPNQMHLSL